MRFLTIAFLLIAIVGCGAPDPRFRLNSVYLAKYSKESEISDQQKQDVADILAAMFGTPDQPFVPTAGESGIENIVEIEKVRLAAGRVAAYHDLEPIPDVEADSSELAMGRGLYRQHCAHCHGISGDGMGPTAAFLNPYPRDYRMGIFKFKSTGKGFRPTHEDLYRILENGIPGTAMPSFKLLLEPEIDSLVHYVKYLSIRGEVERRLIEDTANELMSQEDRLETTPDYLIDDVLSEVTARWINAEAAIPQVPPRPDWNEEETLASIRKGRELFYGQTANCVKCHGDGQLGDGELGDYDDWVKDYEDLSKISDAGQREQVIQEFASLHALTPRPIRPRNLRQGVFRGGRRPVDVYLRIFNGIDGTPMPGASMKPPESPPTEQGLTSDDIWHLVDYVLRYLPYESLGTASTHHPTYMREQL